LRCFLGKAAKAAVAVRCPLLLLLLLLLLVAQTSSNRRLLQVQTNASKQACIDAVASIDWMRGAT
jgi:hypothetical protein